ncbi:MAG: hypothetical protein AAF937_11615 [Planctomycetota bacterium]
MIAARPLLLLACCATLLGGCSIATPIAAIDSRATLGEWTIAQPGDEFGEGVRVTDATIRVTEQGFDRVTTIERDQRRVEVGESGSWTIDGASLALVPETVTVIVTQPGDVSAETFEPENTEAAARLSLIGDRLVLEMLESGQPVGRIAYLRER